MIDDPFSRSPSIIKFLKDAKFLKPLGPSLGVNWMWTKRSDHARKSECVCFNTKQGCPKRTIFYLIFSPLCLPFPLLPPFSPLIATTFCIKRNDSNILNGNIYAMVPWFLQQENLFCLSYHKIRWTMIVDNIGLKRGIWGTSSFMVTLTFFSWFELKWSWDKIPSQSQYQGRKGRFRFQKTFLAQIEATQLQGKWTTTSGKPANWGELKK
jgi:hypothetical protein